ncbi:MAG TPA: hypothetical protein VGK67_03745 [Myxococcales bacterium]|jgi:hypothetical protein
MSVLRTYSDALVLTGRALAKSPWTLLLPAAYAAVLVPASAIAGAFGILGGFLYALVVDALLASALYVVSELVTGSRVQLKELPQSVRHYFWPIMNVLFVLWIAGFVVRPLLHAVPNAGALMLGIWAVLFILLNAVPEILYRRGTYGGLAAIGESVAFVQEHWLVWLPPNLAVAALLWFGLPVVDALPLGVVLGPAVGGALVFTTLVFRGHLFAALDGTTARQRALRQRLGR